MDSSDPALASIRLCSLNDDPAQSLVGFYGSGVTDAATYTRALEAADRTMWQRWCATQEEGA